MTAPPPPWLAVADRCSAWSTLHAVVLGLGVSGAACAAALARLGSAVTVLDERNDDATRTRAQLLEPFGVTVELDPLHELPTTGQLVIPSPGVPPTHRWLATAAPAAVWSGEQLAWRLRGESAAPWITVTGTNGKTTTVQMLAAILQTSGLRCVAAGNIGVPLVEAVLAEPAADVLAVELSSFQLHFTRGLKPAASALLNVGVDHVDWHGSLDNYMADKAKIFDGTQRVAVHNAQDARAARLAAVARVASGCRHVAFRSTPPKAHELGVRGGMLVDRAFTDDPSGRELASVDALCAAGAHNAANALAAAALALANDVAPEHIDAALRAFRPDPHRGDVVAVVDAVTYVDDSKATNVDAASVSLAKYQRVIWIAGGVAKGVQFDDLVTRHRSRLRGVVLLGADRDLLAEALRRHAPDVRVLEVFGGDTDVMDHVVDAAAGMAAPGDTVLLAPACASLDQFPGYAARGDAFVNAVRRRGRTTA